MVSCLEGQFDRSCRSLAGVHSLGYPYQVAQTLLAKEEHFLALPLNREPDGLLIAVMSIHWSTHIDCMALALESTALVLVEAVAVVADVGDNACHWM